MSSRRAPVAVDTAQGNDWDQFKQQQKEEDVARARVALDEMLAAEKPSDLGEAVRALLLVHGRTQKAVALGADIRPESFSRILNGHNTNPISRKTIDKVIAQIGCTVLEADLLYRAAGYAPTDISEQFVASRRFSLLVRQLASLKDGALHKLAKEWGIN